MLAGPTAAAVTVAVEAATVSSGAVPRRALRRETFSHCLGGGRHPPAPPLRPSLARQSHARRRHGRCSTVLGRGARGDRVCSRLPPQRTANQFSGATTRGTGQQCSSSGGRERRRRHRRTHPWKPHRPRFLVQTGGGGGDAGTPQRRHAERRAGGGRCVGALTSRRRPCASVAPRGSRDVLFMDRPGRSVVPRGDWSVGARRAHAADAVPARQLQWPRAAESGGLGAEYRRRGTSPSHATPSRSGGRAGGRGGGGAVALESPGGLWRPAVAPTLPLPHPSRRLRRLAGLAGGRPAVSWPSVASRVGFRHAGAWRTAAVGSRRQGSLTLATPPSGKAWWTAATRSNGGDTIVVFR